jgi:hypothetical protein
MPGSDSKATAFQVRGFPLKLKLDDPLLQGMLNSVGLEDGLKDDHTGWYKDRGGHRVLFVFLDSPASPPRTRSVRTRQYNKLVTIKVLISPLSNTAWKTHTNITGPRSSTQSLEPLVQGPKTCSPRFKDIDLHPPVSPPDKGGESKEEGDESQSQAAEPESEGGELSPADRVSPSLFSTPVKPIATSSKGGEVDQKGHCDTSPQMRPRSTRRNSGSPVKIDKKKARMTQNADMESDPVSDSL